MYVDHTFSIHNSGSVPLDLEFSVMESAEKLKFTGVHSPEEMVLLAGEEADLPIGICMTKYVLICLCLFFNLFLQ